MNESSRNRIQTRKEASAKDFQYQSVKDWAVTEDILLLQKWQLSEILKAVKVTKVLRKCRETSMK